MTNEEREIYQGILEAKEGKRPCALATVVLTKGSTPRKNGAKMLVDPALGLIGTVGGGCSEAEVVAVAKGAIETGEPQIVHVDLTEEPLAWTGSICGGSMEVFVEPIYPEGP